MDVKYFFRKKLLVLLAVFVVTVVCYTQTWAADNIYAVGKGGTITGSKDITEYKVSSDNDYTATFQNSTTDTNLESVVVSNWTVTNDNNTHGHEYYSGHNPVIQLGGTNTSSTPVNVEVLFTGNNTFGSGMNTGGSEGDPATAREVNVIFASKNEDLTGTSGSNATVTFLSGTTRFWGTAQFGGIDSASTEAGWCDVTFIGATTIFENQNTYFGAGGWQGDSDIPNKNGGTAYVDFVGGTTTFNQRAVFGGATSNITGTAKENWVHAGDSNVNFAGGVNTFTDKNVNWPNSGSEPSVEANQKNYYGVYFSAMGGPDGLTQAGTANVNISNGINTFDVEVHSAGNYNLTPTGDIIRSKDDFEITWGGVSNFNISGGVNSFNGRTTFGAANGESYTTFTAGQTTFGGKNGVGVRSLNMGKGDIIDDSPWSSINTNYNGQDTPYVFFGGKYLSDDDVAYWNEYYTEGHGSFKIASGDYDNVTPTTQVTITGRSKVVLNTVGFVGGANYNELAGSSDLNNGYTTSLTKDFVYGDEGDTPTGDNSKAFTNDVVRFNTNADTADSLTEGKTYTFTYDGTEYTHNLVLNDAGAGNVNLEGSGELRLGIYNTTQLYNAPDSYIVTDPDTGLPTKEVTPVNAGYTLNRNAQVQLIGNNANFTATGGKLYFTTEKNGTTCLNANGATVDRLNVGRIVFKDITITDNTNIYLNAYNSQWGTLIGKDGQDMEYYTIEAFKDADGTQLKIGSQGTDGQYHYQRDYLFYSIGVEGLANEDGTPNANYTDQARLHLFVHDPHTVVPDGNLGNNMDEYIEDITADNQPEDFREALDDIWNSGNKVEAQEKFDDLAGGLYGNWLNSQVQRLTSFNNMVSNRSVTDDMGLDQFICRNNCETGIYCEPGCCACGCRRQCEFGGRGIGTYQRYSEPRRSVWGSFLGNYGDGNYWDGYTKYHEESSGMAVGVEWKNVCCRLIGLYFSYSDTLLSHSNQMGNSFSKLQSNDFMVGMYAKWDAHLLGGYTLMHGNYTFNDLDSDRFYNTQTFDNTFESNQNGMSASAYIERGWMYVEKHGYVINPYGSVQYAYVKMDDFTETGTSSYGGYPYASNMAIHAYDMYYHSLRGQLGVRVSRDFVVGNDRLNILRTTIGGAYAHEFLDPQATYYTEIMGNVTHNQYEMKSNACSRDWANVMFSVDYRMSQRLSCNFSFDGYFNQYKTVRSFNATLRYDY